MSPGPIFARARGILLLWAVASAQIVQGLEVPAQPTLRIETAMHTATISRIATDAKGRFVVTGSWDKTVRVWETGAGRLQRTIHLPAGGGNEGQVYALAVTPNGGTIAAGGWTGWDWEGTASIYLFDRENGRLVRRISGLPGRPIRLTYSPDGRWLAAGLRGAHGIRLFDPSGRLAGEDSDYGDDSGGIAFSEGGKLVTSSRDGFLRLYTLPKNGQPLRLVEKRRSDGGLHPFGISFSPDGLQVAIGFEDTSTVAILSGIDLSPIRRADTASVVNGNLASVAWSADGSQLYAGGMSADDHASRIVRIWTGRGAGPWRDVPVSADTVMDIAPFPGGGFVFAAGDPAWGRVSSAGERQFLVRSGIADYRGGRDRLLVSSDGLTVQFEFKLGATPARYSIADRALSLQSTDTSSMRPPRVAAPGLRLENWENSSAPALNGRRLDLERDDEVVRSIALTEDGVSVLVGTDWNLILFDHDSARRWSVSLPDVAWAVNVSADASLAIAALADGTIRWYRLTDGEELFSLFPTRDGKWVLWTAEGYYDCSPGAEELIGWSVNHGRDNAADFFPVSRFRTDFYRPDVLANLAATRNHDEAVQFAKASRAPRSNDIARLFPPTVRITSPADGSSVASRQLAVFYEIHMLSGEPVTSVQALVNGRPVAAFTTVRDPALGAARTNRSFLEGELTIPIPPKDAEITIIAANRFSASVPESRHLHWNGAQAADTAKPALYLLAIGVGKYRGSLSRLTFPGQDAQDFATVLEQQKGQLYAKVETKTLRDRQATRAAVLEALRWLRDQRPNATDTVVVFLAGHGETSNGQYYFLPYDADQNDLATTAVPGSEIETAIGRVPARAMLFIDTCHAGALFSRGLAGDLTGTINELSSPEHGIVVFAASTGAQTSLENDAWGNGAFTKAVVEGLGGHASLGPEITVAALETYVSRRVLQLTAGQQTPATAKPVTVPDYPIAIQAQ